MAQPLPEGTTPPAVMHCVDCGHNYVADVLVALVPEDGRPGYFRAVGVPPPEPEPPAGRVLIPGEADRTGALHDKHFTQYARRALSDPGVALKTVTTTFTWIEARVRQALIDMRDLALAEGRQQAYRAIEGDIAKRKTAEPSPWATSRTIAP